MPPTDVAHRNSQHGESAGNRDDPVLCRGVHGGPVDRLDVPVQPLPEQPRWRRNDAPENCIGTLMRKMRWQHEDRLDQRHEEHRNRHRRDLHEQFAFATWHEEHRQKSDHIGGHGEKHRTCNLPSAENGGIECVHAFLPLLVDVLSNDDGIVHDDAKGHEKREERDHVDRSAADRQEKESAQNRNRNAEHDPKRKARLQEQTEHQQHQ